MIYQQVKLMLKHENIRSKEMILEKINMVLSMYNTNNLIVDINIENLVRELESEYSVWNENASELVNNEDHLPWLNDKKDILRNGFWTRYETYLEQDKKMAIDTVMKLDDLTNSILDKLEDPYRAGTWDRRGMVVGQVQSGKTSNYTGLICKAADSGYKLIIVLAGIHKSLRSQTQYRIDEGFLGRDTQRERIFSQDNHRLGAGAISSKKPLVAHSMTSSADNGDFNSNQTGGTALGGDPVIVIVKKNKTVLKNLLKWILSVQGEKNPGTGKKIVRNIPLLLIDDEADHASININDEKASAINSGIRDILNSFDKKAYVGYTATPFANIFIQPDVNDSNFGPDLFPKSFIINIPAPSNYIGPAQVFGLKENVALGIEKVNELPIIREIDNQEYQSCIPDSHKADLNIEELPDSLYTAIKSFVLSCAARLARGQENQHNSMLIHVTRFIKVQNQIEEKVKKEVLLMRKNIEKGSQSEVMNELQHIWNNDFIPTTKKIIKEVEDSKLELLSWENVKKYIYQAILKIQIKRINGSAKDVLDYIDHKSGLSVIAIGGDKLSRGLTLEGLTISYYLRGSRMYDTLMQMGRWFGYRPGYVDLCRLYTSTELIKWYKHIAEASEELRLDFEYMAASGRTPSDFGLKVRTHPTGMIVTGANKMKNGTKMKVSFADTLAETTVFHKHDNSVIENNFNTTEQFIRKLKNMKIGRSNNYIWQGVDAIKILDFLSEFTGHPNSRRSNPQKLKEYIENQQTVRELTEWTVVLKNTKDGNEIEIGDISVKLSERSDDNKELENKQNEYKMIRNHIITPLDEGLDLSEKQMEEALIKTREDSEAKKKKKIPNTAGGHFIRNIRNPKNGLIIIYLLDYQYIHSEGQAYPYVGFAISFPGSFNSQPIEYVVNNIYWEEEFAEE